MMMPTVAAVIPTYNRAQQVRRAIESVLAQSRPCDEVIVVDDGSTDDTPAALAAFGDRIRAVRRDNGGVSAARNTAVAACACDLIAFLDSDDYWHERKIEDQLPLMRDPGVVLSATDWARECDDGGSAFARAGLDDPAVRSLPPLAMLARVKGNGFWLPTWMVRRSAFQRVGGFDERMSRVEDTRLLFRLAFEGRFALLPEVRTVRSSDEDEVQLTRLQSTAYRAEMVPATLEVLLETYARAWGADRQTQSHLRQMISHFSLSHAKVLAEQGDSRGARRRAIECLAFQPRLRQAARSLGLLAAPRLFAGGRGQDGRNGRDTDA